MIANDLYKKRMFEYFKDTRFSAPLINPDVYFSQTGVVCSDQVELFINLNATIIQQFHCKITGCIVASACAAMLAEFCQAKAIAVILTISEKDFLENIVQICITGSRKECAILAFNALQKKLTLLAK